MTQHTLDPKMLDVQLSELRKLLDSIPDSWEVVSLTGIDGPYAIRMPFPKGGTFYGVRMIAFEEYARFIALARNVLPFLLDELEKARVEGTQLYEALLKAWAVRPLQAETLAEKEAWEKVGDAINAYEAKRG